MNLTRIVVVEDSPLIRQILVDMLRREPDLDVVGYARDGEEALLRIAELSPDVITLDVEMPHLDGLGCLQELMAVRPIPAVMVATLASSSAEATLQALAIGAVDFVLKPDNGSISTLRGIREEFVAKIRRAGSVQVRKNFGPPIRKSLATATDKVVFLASAEGGPRALQTLFSGLPQGFAAPVFVSHGLPAEFAPSLAKLLNEQGAMTVRIARAGDRMEPGVALIAPDRYSLKVDAKGVLRANDELSVDSLFRSAAATFGERCIAAVLTGSGSDGAQGLDAIRQAGGQVFAESEATCLVYGMAKAAMESGALPVSVPIEAMGEAIAAAASIQSSMKEAA